jgi:hypothetical protein
MIRLLTGKYEVIVCTYACKLADSAISCHVFGKNFQDNVSAGGTSFRAIAVEEMFS